MPRRGSHLILVFAALALLSSGCGGGSKDRPPLGRVHGRVTLDGQPLEQATVVFTPLEVGGCEASGLTDAKGEYVLRYHRDDMGAALGKNSVRITKQPSPDLKSELLPGRYNRYTTLTAEVKSGNNDLPFDLTSQPD
jgi:hypothetical protein